MNVMIDFILCILALAVLLVIAGKNTIVVISRFLALVLAVLGAVLVTAWTAAPLAKALPNPMYRAAACDLAELAGVSTDGDPFTILSRVDLPKIEQEQPEALDTLLARYNLTRLEVNRRIASIEVSDMSTEYAATMGEDIWQAIVAALERLLLTVILYVVLVQVFRGLLYHFFPKDRKKRIVPLTILFSVLCAVVTVSYVAIPLLNEFRPYSMGILNTLRMDFACSHSALYQLFSTLYIG